MVIKKPEKKDADRYLGMNYVLPKLSSLSNLNPSSQHLQFKNSHLHIVNVVAVPKRQEEPICKTKYQLQI
jgi:hypothetical protein